MLLSILFPIAGCNVNEDVNRAKKVMDNYFYYIDNNQYIEAQDLYSDSFFEERSKEEAADRLRKVYNKLGKIKSYQLQYINFRKVYGDSESGTYIDLTYKVEYSNCTSTDDVTLFKPAEGKEYKIIYQFFTSEGFIMEE